MAPGSPHSDRIHNDIGPLRTDTRKKLNSQEGIDDGGVGAVPTEMVNKGPQALTG